MQALAHHLMVPSSDTLLQALIYDASTQPQTLAYLSRALEKELIKTSETILGLFEILGTILPANDPIARLPLDNLEGIAQLLCSSWDQEETSPGVEGGSPNSKVEMLGILNSLVRCIREEDDGDSDSQYPYLRSLIIRFTDILAKDSSPSQVQEIGAQIRLSLNDFSSHPYHEDSHHRTGIEASAGSVSLAHDTSTTFGQKQRLDPLWLAEYMSDGAPLVSEQQQLEEDQSPEYILITITKAIRSSWRFDYRHPKSDDILPAFKDLIHMGPFLANSPIVFFQQLILGSLDILLESLRRMASEDKLRSKHTGSLKPKPSGAGPSAINEEQGVQDDMMGMIAADEEIPGDRNGKEETMTGESLMQREWSEMIWMMKDLPACLGWWRQRSGNAEGWRGLDYPVSAIWYMMPYIESELKAAITGIGSNHPVPSTHSRQTQGVSERVRS